MSYIALLREVAANDNLIVFFLGGAFTRHYTRSSGDIILAGGTNARINGSSSSRKLYRAFTRRLLLGRAKFGASISRRARAIRGGKSDYKQ